MALQLKTIFGPFKHTLIPIILMQLSWIYLSGLDPDKPVDRYLSDQWKTSEGLPSDSILSIAQTPDGYLWIASNQGLVRYDGMKFSLIPFIEGRAMRPMENTIPDTLFVNKEGILWIGSAGRLTSYQFQTGRFKTFTTSDGMTRDRVRRINEDMKGNLWISFFSSYVDRFSHEKFTAFNEFQGLKGKKVNAIIEDRNGNLLFGTRENGVFIFKAEKFSPYPIPGLENLNIITMYEDGKGELWIGTNNGLYRLTEKGTQKYTSQHGLSNDHITYILEDSDQNLWVGTLKGLNRIRKNQDNAINIEPVSGSYTVTCLFEDKEKSLWIGTYDSGLNRLKEGKFRSFPLQPPYREEFLLSVFEDRSGDTWIGTLSGKLLHWRGSTFIESLEPPELSGTGIVSIAQDADGNLWLGTSGKGIFQKRNGSFTPFTTREGLTDDVVVSIFRDGQGNLWLSTFDGVSVLRNRNGVFGSIDVFDSPKGLLGKRVHNIYEDKEQNIWIATDNGITVLEKGLLSKEKIKYYFQGIPVTCIYEARPNDGSYGHPSVFGGSIFWIATQGAGLKRLNPADGSIVSYTTVDGLTTPFLYQFFEDPQENFWLMSNNGILRVGKKELEQYGKPGAEMINCTAFGTSDGLNSLEFNNELSKNSALKASNGEFWFITKNGISIVNPAKIRINKIPPPVVIETALFNERPIVLHQEIPAFKSIETIRFRFTAPTFLSPEKVKFKYRLEGFDKKWAFLLPGQERVARYKNLKPGTYTFRVMACNAEGVWNQTGDSLTFALEAYFYETLTFKIAVPVFLVVLAAAAWFINKKRPFIHRWKNKVGTFFGWGGPPLEKKEKYKDTSLAPQFVEELVKKLKNLMETKKIYREADLSLTGLAEKLSVPPHVLSQVLNEQLNRNFADFINSYRIEEAKEILGGPGGAQAKITNVAFDVGFNTIVAFYNAFKKYTHMTPAQYKRSATASH